MVILHNFSPTSSHRHPLQVENCNSNSRLIVDEDDNGKGCCKVKKIPNFQITFGSGWVGTGPFKENRKLKNHKKIKYLMIIGFQKKKMDRGLGCRGELQIFVGYLDFC